MSHPVGGRYDASHGEIGVLLAHVVDYNSSVAADRLRTSRAAGVTVGAAQRGPRSGSRSDSGA